MKRSLNNRVQGKAATMAAFHMPEDYFAAVTLTSQWMMNVRR